MQAIPAFIPRIAHRKAVCPPPTLRSQHRRPLRFLSKSPRSGKRSFIASAASTRGDPQPRTSLAAHAAASTASSHASHVPAPSPCTTAATVPQLIPPVIDIAPLFAHSDEGAGSVGGAGAEAAALRAETLRQITAACETWGFFHVLNHGVPAPLQQELQHQMRLFFHAGEAESIWMLT